ncbi:helix-turn-helix domain containing protein [Streptomyces sp. NPDC058398]|uniref:helix-turn-helix domain containing protein n=1 Tax=Streptomyces sp. NPDC058398 TaxID=3346479 RepID=UPI0036495FA8
MPSPNARPEWAAAIWSGARSALLVQRHREDNTCAGALHTTPGTVAAFRTDAPYLTAPQHWPHHVQRHQSQRPQQGRLDHPHRIGTGRVGAQAIDPASSCLRPLIAEAARQGLRLAFTVRFARTSYLHPSGSRTGSPVIRTYVTQRADHTEERSYGSAQAGGHDAADFARRVDVVGGDVSAAVHQWLVETRRTNPDARILHLEVRTWRPR